ncbi:MAG: hypothetical protein FWE93_06895 [Alphaproteobacteria bacterium]|nr:hypothetical protein [Alphaproteobacteria bacterium]
MDSIFEGAENRLKNLDAPRAAFMISMVPATGLALLEGNLAMAFVFAGAAVTVFAAAPTEPLPVNYVAKNTQHLHF